MLSPDERIDDDIGEALGEVGNYEILNRIAAGGMGVVYRARQKGLDRVVALKLIPEGRLASENDIKRFLFEARAAAELEHPNIAPIYEVGEDHGQPFFAMRYIDGGDLCDWIDAIHSAEGSAGFRDNLAASARMMVKIARAVEYAHGRNIIHRDLKPQNILVDQRGEPQITDFGIAKKMGSDEHLTLGGQALGSPAYMAPEQLSGRELAPTSDVYSLGIVFYQMLCGELPFQGDTPLEVIKQTSEASPRRLRDRNRQIDEELETVCLKCLEKEPADRFESAEALADDLSRWLAGEPVRARPLPRTKRIVRWANRHRIRVASAVAVMVALALGAGVLFSFQFREATRNSELYATHIRIAADRIREQSADWRQTANSELTAAARSLPGLSRPIEWRLLFGKITPPVVATGKISESGITGIAIAREDPLYLAVATRTGILSVWATDNIRKLREQNFAVNDTPRYYNGDGETLLIRDQSGKLKVVGGKREIELHTESSFMARSDLAYAMSDGATGSKIRGEVPNQSGDLTRFEVSLTQDMEALAIGGRKFVAFASGTHCEIWNVAKDPAVRETWIDHDFGKTVAIDFSSNGMRIATGTADGTVRIWGTRTGKLECTFSLGTAYLAAVAFVEPTRSIPMQWLAAVGENGEFKVWDLLRTTAAYHPISDLALPMVLSSDSHFLIGSRPKDNGIGIVDLSARGFPVKEASLQGTSLAIGIADTEIVTLAKSNEGFALMSTTVNGGNTAVIKQYPITETIESAVVNPDGRLALIDAGSRLRVIDCATGNTLFEKSEPGEKVRLLAVSNNALAFGSRQSLMRMVNLPDLSETTLENSFNPIHAAFSHDGKRIAVASDNRLATFSLQNGSWKIDSTVFDGSDFGPIAWSADNRTLITASTRSRKLLFFAAETGHALYPLDVLGDWKQVTCSQDGRHIIAATADKVFVISVPMYEDSSDL
ncbi:MAG: protein kinase [Verrucomicrobiae bacterium]|nr:protein kinase [Verrucomicrobiae bacterium]